MAVNVTVNETTEAVTVTVAEGILPGQLLTLLSSGNATAGYLATASGNGTITWEPNAGLMAGDALTLLSSGNATAGYAPLSNGNGTITWGAVATPTAWDDLTGTVDVVPFDTTPETTPTSPGSVFWNVDEQTIEVVQDGDGNSISVGKEMKVMARNVSGSTIADGLAVYINGEASQRPSIALASVSNAAHVASTIGIASESINSPGFGKVTTQGLVNNINTTGLTAGQPLYLQENGTYNHTVSAVRIGWCMAVGNGNGKIYVSVARMQWYSADILDASAGGGGAADADKLVKFGAGGGISAADFNGQYANFTNDPTESGSNAAVTANALNGGAGFLAQNAGGIAFGAALTGAVASAAWGGTWDGYFGQHTVDGTSTPILDGAAIGVSGQTGKIAKLTDGVETGAVAPWQSIHTSSFTAVAGTNHATIGTVTVTDPATITGTTQWYRVSVLSGTAVIGGVTYQASRFPIIRFSNAGGAWATVPPYLTDALDVASAARATSRTNLGAGAVGDTLFTAATVAAALGALQMQTLSPSGNVVVTSNATPANVAGMSFSVAASTTYVVALLTNVDAGAGGYDVRLDLPSLLNGVVSQNGYGMRFNGASLLAVITMSDKNLRVANRTVAQTGPEFAIFGFTTGATPGTANFQFAQASSNIASSTLLASTRALIIRL